MPRPYRPVPVSRLGPSGWREEADAAATEEPLEIRVHGEPFAVVMRTPGEDSELAAGFLLSERVIREPAELGALRHCERADADASAEPNVIDAILVGIDPATRLDARRRVIVSASCGLCGRTTLDALRVEAPGIEASWEIGARLISELPGRLRSAQVGFDVTGGLHAAGVFDREGRLESFAEDVGRHNAVDKVIGRRVLADDFPIPERVLVVSGRASYEILQKAFLAGIAIVAAVSAPSSLAIDLARETGITLLGFVRDGSFNVYAHAERIRR